MHVMHKLIEEGAGIELSCLFSPRWKEEGSHIFGSHAVGTATIVRQVRRRMSRRHFPAASGPTAHAEGAG